MIIGKKPDTVESHLSATRILSIFQRIKNEDLEAMGFNTERFHPASLVLEVLPVIPPSARSSVTSGGVTCDDDLTTKYTYIVKQNAKINTFDNNDAERKMDREAVITSLEFHIKTLMDNSDKKSKHTNGRPFKSIKQRMNGKDSIIRNNMSGKRVNFSARTVAGPEPTLRVNEVGIPKEVMDTLTRPVKVFALNKEWLEKEIDKGNANFVIRGDTHYTLKYLLWSQPTRIIRGDRILREGKEFDPLVINDFELREGDVIKRGRELIKDIKLKKKKKFNLHIGDVVELKMKDGDYCLVNRQPTLWKGGFMGFKAVKIPGKTVRTSLAVTNSFNLDYDGDEMNIHFPQTEEARAEAQHLCGVAKNILSNQSNNALLCMVQDTLISAFLMTKECKEIKKGYFFDYCMAGDDGVSKKPCGLDVDFVLNKLDDYKRVMEEKGKEYPSVYNSRSLFSMALPPDLIYEKKTDICEDEPYVRIVDGILYEGCVTKKLLGKGSNGLIQIIHKEYGEQAALTFINNVQFISDAWMSEQGFSVGISDCYGDSKTIQATIEDTILKCISEANTYEKSKEPEVIKEAKINASLNKARDIGIKIIKESLEEDNGFKTMIMSEARGSYINMAQISGLLGQQNIMGGRVGPEISGGTRTLSHYAFGESEDPLTRYESRGFISGSFFRGLNEREFFFHAMTGRIGIIDTACRTSLSGYTQRKMVKMMEDLQVHNDMTVRRSSGEVVQFNYGEDNFDPSRVLRLNKRLTPCNIKRMVDRLNRKHKVNRKRES